MNRPTSVLLFGDSNTHGSQPMRHLDDVRRYAHGDRWAGLLAADLGTQWHIHEEGLPGRTTVHPDPIEGAHLRGIDSVPVLIGTHAPVDVVVIALGVNDLKSRFAVSAVSVAALVGAVRTSSAAPGRSSPSIIVVSPPPILETGCLARWFEGGRAKSLLLAEQFRDVADRCGAAFVDGGAHVRSSSVDGIHWDADQQPLMAFAIARTISALRS